MDRGLRILFFGSDLFSWHSLNAIYKLHNTVPSLVQDVKVCCRPPKIGGRGNKKLYKSMVYEYMEHFGLLDKLTLCDTAADIKKEWSSKLSMFDQGKANMIICASYGLLIPSQVIRQVPYTLNLHPSLLPRYQGCSPIQTTLLNQDKYTGITIQTLDPYKFDRGKILDQSAPVLVSELLDETSNKMKIPSHFLQNTSTRRLPRFTERLMDQLGYISGVQLTQFLASGRYQTRQSLPKSSYSPSWTQKMTAKDRHINCSDWTAQQIYTRLNTLGPLFVTGKEQNFFLHEVSPVVDGRVPQFVGSATPSPVGTIFSLDGQEFLVCKDGTAVLLRKFSVLSV